MLYAPKKNESLSPEGLQPPLATEVLQLLAVTVCMSVCLCFVTSRHIRIGKNGRKRRRHMAKPARAQMRREQARAHRRREQPESWQEQEQVQHAPSSAAAARWSCPT